MLNIKHSSSFSESNFAETSGNYMKNYWAASRVKPALGSLASLKNCYKGMMLSKRSSFRRADFLMVDLRGMMVELSTTGLM